MSGAPKQDVARDSRGVRMSGAQGKTSLAIPEESE